MLFGQAKFKVNRPVFDVTCAAIGQECADGFGVLIGVHDVYRLEHLDVFRVCRVG